MLHSTCPCEWSILLIPRSGLYYKQAYGQWSLVQFWLFHATGVQWKDTAKAVSKTQHKQWLLASDQGVDFSWEYILDHAAQHCIGQGQTTSSGMKMLSFCLTISSVINKAKNDLFPQCLLMCLFIFFVTLCNRSQTIDIFYGYVEAFDQSKA